MKKRTFFTMLFLFLVFLNSMILIASIVILNDKLSNSREQCMSEHYVIASSLIQDIQALEQRGDHAEENIEYLIRPYSRYLQGKGDGIAIAFSGNWIYESPELNLKEHMVSPPDTGSRQERLVYMESGTPPLLYVYGSFPAPLQDYGLLYIGNLTDVVSSWRHTKNILFLMGTVMLFVMAFFLFQFLTVIFRPLRQISSASTKIAEGDYGSRLPVRGKDEIASVASNFNLMAEKVETQIQHLQDTAEQKQQFIDNFSHELRIPLTAIYGYAEYIQKAPVSEKERYECTQFIMSECSRLQNMAYQLLDMALLRNEAITYQDFSVAALFEQSEKIMHVQAKEKYINLSYHIPQNFLITGNREYLLILLNNLIDNALKASQPEGKVYVSVYKEGQSVVIEVKDHGIGMQPDQISHIKEAFYRVDKSRSRTAGGTGLGLAVCERIAQLHHAKLTFASERGKGTVVRLIFPQAGKTKSFTSP